MTSLRLVLVLESLNFGEASEQLRWVKIPAAGTSTARTPALPDAVHMGVRLLSSERSLRGLSAPA